LFDPFIRPFWMGEAMENQPRAVCRLALSLLFAMVWVTSTTTATKADAADGGKPNFLIIVSDNQGYADLGCFGNADVQTPHIDRIAQNGVKLTSFYVTWPACTPSRGSILTGRYPQRNGLYGMIRNYVTDYDYQYNETSYAFSPEMTLGLDVREMTFGQTLKTAGYTTGVVGKWDSGRPRRFLPLQRGFDSFYGFACTGIDYFTHERYGIPSMFRGDRRIEDDKGTYATELFRREAIRFIRDAAERPWCLYLPFNCPHGSANFDRPGTVAMPEYLARYPDHDSGDRLTHYMAAITQMDDAIGDLLALLRELELDRRTLVLFFSDNGGAGPSDNGPLRGRMSQLWEGGIRVCAVAQWPGVIPAGLVCDEFLSSLDVFPTLAAAAGVKLPEDLVLDGHDALSVLKGEASSPRNDMFWCHRDKGWDNRAARIGRYKWLQTNHGGGLYDLSTDLGERHDLSQQRPELLAQITAKWEAWRKAMDQTEPRGPFRDY